MVTVKNLGPLESKNQGRDKGGLELTGGYDLQLPQWILPVSAHVSLFSWSSTKFQGDLSCLQSHRLWSGLLKEHEGAAGFMIICSAIN